MASAPAGRAPAPREDLLLAASIDLDGEPVAGDIADRFATALLLGKAGDVRTGHDGGAAWAIRAFGAPRRGARPQIVRGGAGLNGDEPLTLLTGRIHHRAETCRRHELDPALSHAELYAALYRLHGERCDTLVAGDYAVVQLFPGQHKVRLTRSPLGQYPLHVWRQGNRISVSSLARALFAIGAPARIDDARVGDMMLLNLRDASSGWFRDLAPIAPGTSMTIDRETTRTRRFWSIDDVKPVRFARDEDYVEAVAEQFRGAARASLEDVRQPAIWLSGGLDSQALASFLVEAMPAEDKLQAFTYVPMAGARLHTPEGMFPDEREHVGALARMYPQIVPHFIDGSSHTYGDMLDKVFVLGSAPTHNEMAAHWTHEGLEQAAAMGCDVIFDAIGGNVGFSYDGRTGYPTWLRQGRLALLLRELRRADLPRPLWWKALSLAVWPNLPVGLRARFDEATGRHESPFANWCPLREDFAHASGALARAREQRHDLTFQRDRSAAVWRKDVLDAFAGDAADLKLSFALLHGVHERDPTTYLPLLELCMGIPDEQYLRDGETRWLARRLLRGRVPEMVRTERRRGYQSADWPARFERDRAALLADIESLARDPRIARMFDFERLGRTLAEWDGEPGDDFELQSRISLAVGRGLATARFVRHVEGRNVG